MMRRFLLFSVVLAMLAVAPSANGQDELKLNLTYRDVIRLHFPAGNTQIPLPYQELDDALRLTEIAGDMLTDTRRGKNGRHGLVGQFRQSVFERLGGYDDVNDADRLGQSPARTVFASKPVQPAPAAALAAKDTTASARKAA